MEFDITMSLCQPETCLRQADATETVCAEEIQESLEVSDFSTANEEMLCRVSGVVPPDMKAAS